MVNVDYLYKPDAVRGIFKTNYFSKKKLSFQVIENGTIIPHQRFFNGSFGMGTLGFGGIVDSNGKYIKQSHVFNNDTWDKSYDPPVFPPESIKHSTETVIYLGLFYPVWGHSLTDNIRRVWFLKSKIFNSEFKNCPLVYLPYQESTLEKQQNFKRLLEILGVDVNKIQAIEQPTQFDKIILADGSFFKAKDSSRRFTKEYRATIDLVRNFALKNQIQTSSKKFYFYHGVRQIGEERLAEYFKSKGYEIVSPEKLTLDEQLNLLINCESFAATVGSCSHNSIFLRDNTEVIFIPREANHFTGYQVPIDQVHPLNINYVNSSLSLFATDVSDYFYLISEQLKKFFGDKFDGYEEDDFKNFLQYVNNSLARGLVINPNKKIHYESILPGFMTQLLEHKDLIAAYNMPPGWEKFPPLLMYQTHVGFKGWGSWIGENQISNDITQECDLQAINIKFPEHKVYYSVYYNDEEGWSAEVLSPRMAGTTGEAKSIYGIRIRLDEAGAKEFDIIYRMHKYDGTWTPWAKNGATIYSHGVKLNAIQIKLKSKT